MVYLQFNVADRQGTPSALVLIEGQRPRLESGAEFGSLIGLHNGASPVPNSATHAPIERGVS